MRVTTTTKQQTRARILTAARKLFVKKGFENTTTRDIAAAAEIASGTVFNYFPSKEALAMTLVAEALDTAGDEFEANRQHIESLSEALFSYVISGLRHLKPFRPFIAQVLEVAMSPFARTSASEETERIRLEHLEVVGQLIVQHTGVREPSFVAMHLYWSLYLGVLAYWSHDESPNQEEALVVLDQATRLFMQSLGANEIEAAVVESTISRVQS